MSSAVPDRRPWVLAVALVVLGIVGFLAAFQLTLDKIAVLENPDAQLSCNFSVLIGCSKNLASPEGMIFGFPNPLLGIAGWTATIAVGAGILSGARYGRLLWLMFNLGVLGALVLAIYLITASVTVLNVLCPWCMVTWAAVIPTFWLVTLHTLRAGILPVPDRARRFSASAYTWIPLITLVCYAIVAIIAQVQLDWLNRL